MRHFCGFSNFPITQGHFSVGQGQISATADLSTAMFSGYPNKVVENIYQKSSGK